MIYDNYAMYDADYLRKDIKRHPQLSTRLIVFVKKRWSMILHHFLLLGFGYLLVVVSQTVPLSSQPNCLLHRTQRADVT